jgi:hypothetical protein
MNDKKFNERVTPYLPVYARPPNKLLRYEERPFWGGICRYAIFTDKNGKQQEMTAQVIWKDNAGVA